ncbi:hypothetical protein [Telluribacter humicola]|uniref:hypothetical protein n=1 Tax=Telluribacter humicola TaxID=1720261 RepID=UPI001A9762C0|nr:hypothetical protein [Telluribacter humicola]
MNGNFKQLLEAGDIVPAKTQDGKLFELEGTQYYEYKDGGVPTRPHRFHAFAETSFEHEAWQMDRDSLMMFMNVFQDFVIGSLANLNNPDWFKHNAPIMLNTVTNVRDRIEHYNSTIEFVYDMASVLYFHEDEDPFTYDITEARKKKDMWRPYPYLYTFFLSMDLNRHVPLGRLSQPDTLTSAAQSLRLMLSTLQNLSSRYDYTDTTSDTMSFIESQTEVLKGYATSLIYLLRNTSITLPPTEESMSER